jgi:hypothetical protein
MKTRPEEKSRHCSPVIKQIRGRFNTRDFSKLTTAKFVIIYNGLVLGAVT